MLLKSTDLFLGVLVDKWVDHLPRTHEYVGRVDDEQLAQPLGVVVLQVQAKNDDH